MDDLDLRSAVTNDLSKEDIAQIIEDIRLTALNMAISAAKLEIKGESRTILRKKISELVNMSLQTVNKLSVIFKSLGSDTSTESKLDPAEYLEQLQTIEKAIAERSEEISLLLRNSELEQ